jgi:hypothetical protein
VGGLSRAELTTQLGSRSIRLNAHAETLLADASFDDAEPHEVTIVECSVLDLGYPEGASLSQIYARAEATGLSLCHPTTGPYLRLALSGQSSAPDAVLRSGRAPSGSITVATRPLRDDDDFPKGFYLRVIDGEPWLRGYTCDDEHIWSPDDRFAFQLPPAAAEPPTGRGD